MAAGEEGLRRARRRQGDEWGRCSEVQARGSGAQSRASRSARVCGGERGRKKAWTPHPQGLGVWRSGGSMIALVGQDPAGPSFQ